MPSTLPCHQESWSLSLFCLVAQVSSFLEWLGHYTWSLLHQIARFGTLQGCFWQSSLWHLVHGPLACQSLANWPPELRDRSIQWQELYPIALACLLWGHKWLGKKPLFHCNNQAVVDIWASGTSQDPLIMHLVRSIFFSAATNHYTVLVTHIVGTNNSIADSLSHLQISRFRRLAPTADFIPTPVPTSAATLWHTT